jgi:hypothetical protein
VTVIDGRSGPRFGTKGFAAWRAEVRRVKRRRRENMRMS